MAVRLDWAGFGSGWGSEVGVAGGSSWCSGLVYIEVGFQFGEERDRDGQNVHSESKTEGGKWKSEMGAFTRWGFWFFYVFSFIYVFLDTKQNLTSNNVLFFFFLQRRRVLSHENKLIY